MPVPVPAQSRSESEVGVQWTMMGPGLFWGLKRRGVVELVMGFVERETLWSLVLVGDDGNWKLGSRRKVEVVIVDIFVGFLIFFFSFYFFSFLEG